MEGFNVKNIIRFKNDIYAGVLGKIIGVYLGRPVEGWTYEAIRDTFGEINYYKNHRTGAPLIVPHGAYRISPSEKWHQGSQKRFHPAKRAEHGGTDRFGDFYRYMGHGKSGESGACG